MISRVLQYAIERHRQRMELKNLSLTDELTGLYNRRGFVALAEQQIKLSCRTKFGFLLFYIDLNNFKAINDTYGHGTGDQVLVEFAKILNMTFRESDIIARIGEDEFVALAIQSVESSSDILLDRLSENMKRSQAKSAESFKLSISAGIETFDPSHPCVIDELLIRADKRMYANKRGEAGSRPA
ncbi:MAG: hypothetical protein COT00_03500 [Candidatus Omnitrophica bacterium CG07_land_8_20_14_0_80_50_8]|nr:MAG: hypothetical protein COT00_03500 [Candidatus Omnitrophica bacterium CG07_land_8_20_14_0_80_50_8]